MSNMKFDGMFNKMFGDSKENLMFQELTQIMVVTPTMSLHVKYKIKNNI